MPDGFRRRIHHSGFRKSCDKLFKRIRAKTCPVYKSKFLPGIKRNDGLVNQLDKVATCGGVYEYANSFNNIFRPSQNLFLNIFIQGFYNPAADSTRRDTLRVILRDTVTLYNH